jgi:hypothetical protein
VTLIWSSALATLQGRRASEDAKSKHLASKKTLVAWIPATSGLCFVLSFISINEHFLDKIRRFRFAFVAVSDIHSPLDTDMPLFEAMGLRS